MKVKYKGHKASMPVYLPIGAVTRSAIKETLEANPYVELSDQDAVKLVQLDPHNFEIADDDEEVSEADERIAAKSEELLEEGEKYNHSSPKKKGRKAKKEQDVPFEYGDAETLAPLVDESDAKL